MPNWNDVFRNIRAAIEVAAREAAEGQQARTRERPRNVRTATARNVCLFWDCNASIRADHIFCYDHFLAFQDGFIDECPECGRAKYEQYDVCLECYRKPRSSRAVSSSSVKAAKRIWFRPEYSEAWKKKDATAEQFFIYLLKLDGGEFYAGQTRELRERLSEHKDGRTQSTSGRNPKLVWFGVVPTREAATTLEVELKKLIASNPREIRRMIISFRDLIRELEYT